MWPRCGHRLQQLPAPGSACSASCCFNHAGAIAAQPAAPIPRGSQPAPASVQGHRRVQTRSCQARACRGDSSRRSTGSGAGSPARLRLHCQPFCTRRAAISSHRHHALRVTAVTWRLGHIAASPAVARRALRHTASETVGTVGLGQRNTRWRDQVAARRSRFVPQAGAKGVPARDAAGYPVGTIDGAQLTPWWLLWYTDERRTTPQRTSSRIHSRWRTRQFLRPGRQILQEVAPWA